MSELIKQADLEKRAEKKHKKIFFAWTQNTNRENSAKKRDKETETETET